MVSAEHERPQSGEGDFRDVVSVEFCDGPNELCGLVRIARVPIARRATLTAALFEWGELIESAQREIGREIANWERAQLDGSGHEVVSPLERWRVTFSGTDGGFELNLEASSAPIAFSAGDGSERYEQLCNVRGTATVGRKRRKLGCRGRRTHAWGAIDRNTTALRRSIYSGFEDGAGLVVNAARPRTATGHGDELVIATLARPDAEPLAFERTLLSTVYGSHKLADKAGAELYELGSEFPRRLSGEAFCSASLELDDRLHKVSFFRWSLDGTPGYGSYQTMERA